MHQSAVLHYPEIFYRLGELGREIDVALRSPALDQLVSCQCMLILNADIGPGAVPPQGMVQVQENEGVLRLRIGETENAAVQGRCHLGLHAVVQKIHGIVVRGAPFLIVAVSGTVSCVRVIVSARVEMNLSGSGHEKEVPEVRNTGAAQMGQ